MPQTSISRGAFSTQHHDRLEQSRRRRRPSATRRTEPSRHLSKRHRIHTPIDLARISNKKGHVIRARAFADGMISSNTKTNTYLIGQDARLRTAPALVYSADLPRSLYDPTGSSRSMVAATLAASGKRPTRMTTTTYQPRPGLRATDPRRILFHRWQRRLPHRLWGAHCSEQLLAPAHDN